MRQRNAEYKTNRTMRAQVPRGGVTVSFDGEERPLKSEKRKRAYHRVILWTDKAPSVPCPGSGPKPPTLPPHVCGGNQRGFQYKL